MAGCSQFIPILNSMRVSVDHVDVKMVAEYWITRIDELLGACMRDHDRLPVDRAVIAQPSRFRESMLVHFP